MLYKAIYDLTPIIIVLGAIFILDKILTPLVPIAVGIVMFIHMLSYFKRHEPKDKQGNVIVKTKYHKLVELFLNLELTISAYLMTKVTMDSEEYSGLGFICDYWWAILIVFLIFPPILNLWRKLFFKFKTFGTVCMINYVISAIILVVKFL